MLRTLPEQFNASITTPRLSSAALSSILGQPISQAILVRLPGGIDSRHRRGPRPPGRPLRWVKRRNICPADGIQPGLRDSPSWPGSSASPMNVAASWSRASLVTAGLLTWSESAITFPEPPPLPDDLLAPFADTIGRGKGSPVLLCRL